MWETIPENTPLTLTWDAPTVDSDGSALTDLDGFNVYEGERSGQYSFVSDVGAQTQVTFDSLDPGTHYIAITAYDAVGNESAPSEEFVVIVTPG